MENPGSIRNLKSVVFVSLLTVLLVGCGNQEEEDAARLKSFVDNAANYMAEGQYKSALIEAQNAYQLDESSEMARRMLGQIFIELGQPRETIDLLATGAELEPETRLLLARAYLDSGRLRSSRAQLKDITNIAGKEGELALLRGRYALADGDNEEAFAQYTIATRQPDTEIKGRLAKASAYLQQGKTTEAIEELETVVAIAPENAEALYLISRVKNVTGDLEGAESYLMQAMSALPSNDFVTPLQYAIVASLRDNLTQQGKTSEALIYSGVLSDLLPGAEETEQRLNAALDSLQSGQFDAARAELEEVRELSPNSEQAGTMLAVLEFLEGNHEAAVSEFEKYIDAETSTSTTLQMFAIAELRLNQPEKVIERLDADIDATDNGKLAALFGIAKLNVGDRDAAEKYMRKAISLDPTNGRLRLPLARLLQSEGANDHALEILQEAYKVDPALPVVQAALIDQHVIMGDLEAANSLVSSLEKKYPDAANTQLLVGNHFFRVADAKRAVPPLKRSLALTDSPVTRHLLARTYLQTTEYLKADEQYRQLIEANPEDVAAYKGLITVYELREKTDEGIAALEGYIKAGKAEAPVLTLSEFFGRRGDIARAEELLATLKGEPSPQRIQLEESIVLAQARKLSLEGNIAGAKKALEDKLAVFPKSPRIIASLVTIEINDNQLASAEALIEKLKSLGEAPIIGILEGDVAVKRGDFKVARDIYYASWQKTPADQVAFKIFQTMQLAKLPEAEIEGFLQEWVEQSTANVVAQFTQAGYYLSVNQYDKAQKGYEAVVEKDPNNVVAYNNLAWVFGEKNPKAALKAAESAYNLAKESPEVMDTYGWFLYKNGDVARAREILSVAAERLPTNAEIQAHLKEVLESDEM